jgi:hypothetical protein
MALSRFVVTSTVTVTPDALATPVAGEPGTGGAAGFGNSATIVPAVGSEGKYGLPGMPLTLLAGTPIWADSAGPAFGRYRVVRRASSSAASRAAAVGAPVPRGRTRRG